ncbi:MAG: hypothetical protein K6G38_01195, partial [Gammaproteobacteria bacterium]|nr:hypothetical protein [Gammaproteobacteria bacterium]
MKVRKFLIAILFSLVMISLVGCGKTTTVKTTTGVELHPESNEYYEYDNTDVSKLALEATKTIRVHYVRDDNTGDYSCYKRWYLWCWDSANGQGGAWYSFTKCDDYGVFMDLSISTVTNGKASNKLGFIVAQNDWSGKDVENDRYIDINESSAGGIQHIYLVQGVDKVFDSAIAAVSDSLDYALLRNSKKALVIFRTLKSDFVPDNAKLSITADGEALSFTVSAYNESAHYMTVEFAQDIDITKDIKISYRFSDTVTDTINLLTINYFDSEDFVNKYTYSGNDLGVSFDNEENPTKTIFKVWAPTSQAMKLNLYRSGDYRVDAEPYQTLNMTKGDKGVWECTVNSDLSNACYYTYTVTNMRGTNEVVDPYAKSAGLNGKRGMVVNFTKLNKLNPLWALDSIPEYGDLTDAIIYEIHVRDMTINPNSGVSEANRGKFLGLTELNTTYTKGDVTVTTALSHLVELGITHVQIQPFYDYSSVDEETTNTSMSETNYNWGYDPLNYNCLEGSYSTNPADGLNRIAEFKAMVMALHAAGIGITMDVVYNHTSSLDTSNFELLVPYYYHRYSGDGKASNGSGCGNEMASNRYMVNKFIRESCEFWMDEYHLSGFRFDLMGLLDNQTMIDVYNESKEIYSDVLVYGEPWTGGTTQLVDGNEANKLTSQKTVQSSLSQSYFAGSNVLVGAFNDIIRNAVRGDNGPGEGWVQGTSAMVTNIINTMKGVFSSEKVNPGQVLNYVSCHDNYTLYDQLIQTQGTRVLENMYTQAEAIILTSQGVAFM